MNFDKYKNKLNYPERVKKECPDCGVKFKEDYVYCSNCGREIVTWYEDEVKDYKKELCKWKDEGSRLYDLFKIDALKDVGLMLDDEDWIHPKADKIFSYAWEKGHAYGYSEIYSNLIDIVDYMFDDEIENGKNKPF